MTTTRKWVRGGVHVTTGDLYRGHIYQQTYNAPTPDGQARCVWQLADQDGSQLPPVVGDYLDAEQVLLSATSWADEPES